MKISNKSFFFFLFTFIILSLICPSINVNAAEGDPIIISDFLKVDLIQFNDNTPGDSVIGLSYIPGGRDLHSFENQGILEGSYNSDTNSFVVWAKSTFGFEITAWSACVIENIYPNIDEDSITDIPYFRYRTWKHGQWPIFGGCEPWGVLYYADAIDKTYHFRYHEVDYGDVLKAHNHDGNIETKVWIDPGRKLSGEITVVGQTFTTPTLESDMLDLTITDMRGGECGSYEDRYTSGDDDEGGVTFTTIDSWKYSGTTLKTIAWLKEQDIGWHTPEELIETTEQQGIRDLSFKGAIFPGSNKNEMTFNLPVRLQPRITQTSQKIPYTHGDIKYYPCCGMLVVYDVSDDKVERDLSVHVYNSFVHYDIEVKLDLFMDVQFSADLSETFLEDPNLVITDRIWDGTVFGQEPNILFPPPDLPWYIWILIIIIIGVGTYMGFKLLSKYLETKKKSVIILRRR